MIISDAENRLSENDFVEIEKLIGEKLPEDVKLHYLNSNGGYPDENYIAGDEYEFTFQGFNSIKYGKVTANSLIGSMRESYGLDKFFPFGFDAGGNIFHLSLEKEDHQHVYLITSDTHEIFWVCNTFTTFVDNLTNT